MCSTTSCRSCAGRPGGCRRASRREAAGNSPEPRSLSDLMDKLTVAVLGTGLMGEPIVRNLLRAGFGVRAWNRTRVTAEPLAQDGAVVCDVAPEPPDGADVVVTMLYDGDTVEQVIAGVLPAMEEDAIWAQMSTVGVAATDRLVVFACVCVVSF